MTTVPYGAPERSAMLLEELGDRLGIPLTAIAQLTRRCNLRCRHCFQADRSGPELSTGQWESVFRRLADAGILFLTVTGGEPVLRKDFLDLVRLARSMSFAVKIKTNGVLLDDELCNAIAEIAVFQVHFSFYSADPSVHDRVTGLAGSHARTVRAARRLRDRGMHVLLNCPIQRDGFDGYGSVVDFAAAEKMDYLFDPGIQVQEDGCAGPLSYRLTEEQVERLFRDPRLVLLTAPVEASRKLHASVCRLGKAMVAVAPNGDVWPCLSLTEPIGNLLQSSLRDIWLDNARLERFARLRWCDLPECRSCTYLPFCVRCHANALHEDGDLLGPSRLACLGARVRARLWAEAHPSGLAPADGSRRLASTGAAAGAAEGSQASTGR